MRILLVAGADEGAALTRLLEAGGGALEVLRFESVEDAMEQLRQSQIDAVLHSINDEGQQTALAAIRQIRKVASDIPVIVLSSSSDSTLGVRVLQAGAQDCLTRAALSTDLLVRSIRYAVGRQSLLTELESRVAELAASEARFRTIIEKTADGIVIVDEDGVVRFVNPAAEQLFGRSAAELHGTEFGFPVVVGETTEIEILRRDGTVRAAELRTAETRWENSRVLLASLRDITDRQKAEERKRKLAYEQTARAAAEAAERRSRFLAEASSILSSSLDYHAALASLARSIVPFMADWCVIDMIDDGRVRRVASAHRHAAEERKLREIQRIVGNVDGLGTLLQRVVNTGVPELLQPADDEWKRALLPGEYADDALSALKPVSLIVVPIMTRNRALGAMLLASVTSDVTYGPQDLDLAQELARRAALAIDNARLYQQAREADQAKSDFLAVMSHELRTPLNAILGYADLMMLGVPESLPQPLQRHVERIQLSARHLLQLIDEILTFTRVEAGREELRTHRVSLNEIASQAAVVIEPLANEKGLELLVELPQETVMLDTDPAKVRQIVLNLLSNAVKFTEQGMVRMSLQHADGTAAIAVQDTGVGISAEHYEKIFEPFWQIERASTRRAGGTGLGLTVCRRLARLLGGEVTVQSRPNQGSTFTLQLPLTTAPGTDET